MRAIPMNQECGRRHGRDRPVVHVGWEPVDRVSVAGQANAGLEHQPGVEPELAIWRGRLRGRRRDGDHQLDELVGQQINQIIRDIGVRRSWRQRPSALLQHR
jgi:hypothetical protein